MELKIHSRGWVGDRQIASSDEESHALFGAMIEIDGHLVEAIGRVRVLHASDDFTTVMVRLVPGTLETVVHTADSWQALTDRLNWEKEES